MFSMKNMQWKLSGEQSSSFLGVNLLLYQGSGVSLGGTKSYTKKCVVRDVWNQMEQLANLSESMAHYQNGLIIPYETVIFLYFK